MIERRRRFSVADATTSAVLVTLVAVLGISIWYAVVRWFDLPKALLPTPIECLLAAIENRDALFRGTLSTGVSAVTGLVVAIVVGSLIAVVFSLSRRLRLAFFPYVILLQTVPIVAIAPLLIIWSGYTFRTVVIVTVIVCLFPIVNSVTSGLMSIDRDASDLFRLYGASRRRQLTKLQIPSAIRHLMLGAKTSSGLAVIGAIVAEFFVGNGTSYDGLGTLMTGWQALTKTDALIAALFASAFLGLALFGSVQLVSATLLRRWTSTRPTR
ncbi:putative aliphatic sulfonates transport permease protein SsuC [Rubripirellula tenax]|uniref:Putative aliphatic sulfonates transport permease protein SsuC n=1 Tax=Rubripirellula tenax TaxID=2528015 RepID=A0A5C6EFF9_9BACT|nr:ABC transporter permease subunit [Rubripirellula tenax]TWU47194.1 putative aliphatic sulfonates transport permease protein SsuC [Rubripirellula tenax]